MLTILVNALSVTNQSGAHVLAGHLDQLSTRLARRCRFVVLYRDSMTDFRRRLDRQVEWQSCPESTRSWWRRAAWEKRSLATLAQKHGATVYFTPSGFAAPRLAIPQVVFCQNPWALVPEARRPRDGLKAWLQRRAYRNAMQTAEVMVFNSRYMQEAYRKNAGLIERRGLVVYQAPDDETRQRAAANQNAVRIPGSILCVSVMGPHKNVETVVRALHHLHAQGVASAHLHLVGSWPDPAYEKEIRSLVETLGLTDAVHVHGFANRAELDQMFASSQVFCLMSRCESFGIPAIEAQGFGTPVVCSNVCAVPEICGDGGLFRHPDDVAGVAEDLGLLLGNQSAWNRYSSAAMANAAKYTWTQCSTPLVQLFETWSQR